MGLADQLLGVLIIISDVMSIFDVSRCGTVDLGVFTWVRNCVGLFFLVAAL